MTTPSLEEAERIADKLLKAIEEGRPLLKDMKAAIKDMQAGLVQYRNLKNDIEEAGKKIIQMIENSKETYQLARILEDDCNMKLELIAAKAAIVTEEIKEMNEARKILEKEFGEKRRAKNSIEDIVAWRFIEE